jgi:hypothetical protein
MPHLLDCHRRPDTVAVQALPGPSRFLCLGGACRPAHSFPQEILMKKLFAAAALSVLAFSVQAKDIADTAVAAGNFKTLATPVHRVRADRRRFCQGAQGRSGRTA